MIPCLGFSAAGKQQWKEATVCATMPPCGWVGDTICPHVLSPPGCALPRMLRETLLRPHTQGRQLSQCFLETFKNELRTRLRASDAEQQQPRHTSPLKTSTQFPFTARGLRWATQLRPGRWVRL